MSVTLAFCWTHVPGRFYADVLTRIVKGYPNSRIDDFLLWAYIAIPELKALA
jgi:hypothetical protein